MTEVEQYAAEAANTRARMQNAMAEIQRRLTPANILHSAKETVRSSGGAAVSRVGSVASANPIILALVGVAMAIILYRHTRSAQDDYVVGYGDDDEYAAYGQGDSYVGERNSARTRLSGAWTQVRSGVTSAGERLGSAGDSVRYSLDTARDTVSHAAAEAAHRAGEGLRAAGRTASSAAELAEHAASAASERAGRAARAAVRAGGKAAEQNPALTVGIGLAAGILLGLLTEDRADAESRS